MYMYQGLAWREILHMPSSNFEAQIIKQETLNQFCSSTDRVIK